MINSMIMLMTPSVRLNVMFMLRAIGVFMAMMIVSVLHIVFVFVVVLMMMMIPVILVVVMQMAACTMIAIQMRVFCKNKTYYGPCTTGLERDIHLP